MKSIIKNTIYAGLGLISDGTDAVMNLGRELAKKADVSEAEGEKIARRFQANSSKAIKSIRKTLDAEVTTLANAIHSAIRADVRTKKAKKSKPASATKALKKKVAKASRKVSKASKKVVKASSKKIAKATRAAPLNGLSQPDTLGFGDEPAMSLQTLISSRHRFAGNLARAADVAGVLVKYGLAGWFAHVDWKPIHDALKSHGGEVLSDEPFEARVRLALTDLGTTFIKLGQMLSTRPDMVGQAMADELSKLQKDIPPDPPEVAVKMIEEELGRPISECFASFNEVVFASASIGQVHEATLKSGRHVVVKVQHPGIEGVIRRDLDVLRFLAEIAEGNDTLKRFQPIGLIREFGKTTLNELDFRRELRNLQMFRRNFAEDETIVFPRPYPELTSGRVLTMSQLKGCHVTEGKKLDKLEIDREELAKRGATAFIQMIFRDGFYHADPHPGNFIVLRNGKIGLIDVGMIGNIDEQSRTQIEDVLMAAGEQDAERLTDNVLRITGTPQHFDRKALSADLSQLFQEYGTQPVGEFDVGGMLNQVTDILHLHQLILPGRISMLIKCLILLEGTGRLLSPTFSLAGLLAPWRDKIVSSRSSVKARFKKLWQMYADWERLAQSIRVILNAISRLDDGHLAIRLDHRNLKAAVNRLVGGLFISSLLFSSALLIGHNVPPVAWSVSIPGALGYIVALFFGVHLLWMYREKANKDEE